MRQLLRYAALSIPVTLSVGLAIAKTPNCNCKIPITAASCTNPFQICQGAPPCAATGLYNVASYSLDCTPNTQGFNTCVGYTMRCADKYSCIVDTNGNCDQGPPVLDNNGNQSSTTVTAYFNNTCTQVVCPPQ